MKPEEKFHSDGYKAINQARWKHLENLGIDFTGKTVLEVGAGIGDHTEWLLSRGTKRIIASDAREENLEIIKEKFSIKQRVITFPIDMDIDPFRNDHGISFSDSMSGDDIVYCYGLLYHLKYPRKALKTFSEVLTKKDGLLLLETAVIYEKSKENDLIICNENPSVPSHSPHGHACRPGRRWIFETLKKYFSYVYVPATQPDNAYFPIDWTQEKWNMRLARAVFIGSKQAIDNPLLLDYLPDKQIRSKK